MQGINMETSSQGCYKAIQIGLYDSYHNKIIDIQNRLPYSKVVYPAIIVLFSCLMEVNHGAEAAQIILSDKWNCIFK